MNYCLRKVLQKFIEVISFRLPVDLWFSGFLFGQQNWIHLKRIFSGLILNNTSCRKEPCKGKGGGMDISLQALQLKKFKFNSFSAVAPLEMIGDFKESIWTQKIWISIWLFFTATHSNLTLHVFPFHSNLEIYGSNFLAHCFDFLFSKMMS